MMTKSFFSSQNPSQNSKEYPGKVGMEHDNVNRGFVKDIKKTGKYYRTQGTMISKCQQVY